MVFNLSVSLLVVLIFAPNLSLGGDLTNDNVEELNGKLENEIKKRVASNSIISTVSSENEHKNSVVPENNIQDNSASETKNLSGDSNSLNTFLKAVGGDYPFLNKNEVALRLYLEGTVTGLVTLKERPVKEGDGKKASLVISGYGDKGAAALAVAMKRAQADENVTVLLLPCPNGSRGTRGIIKNKVHYAYENIETWLRNWSEKNENKIKFVTVMDHDTTYEDPSNRTVFQNAAKELNTLREHYMIAANALSAADGDTSNAEFMLASKKLGDLELKYFTEDLVPRGKLENSINEVMPDLLESLGENYDYCFEGHSGQGFQAQLGTHFSEPVMELLINLKDKQVELISTDYQLGMTDEGLQTDIDQYEPNMIIVIFLRPSLLISDSSGYQLKNVQIVQVDWNTVVAQMFSEVPENLVYTTAPEGIQESMQSVLSFENVKYRFLKSMVDSKTDWDKAAAK